MRDNRGKKGEGEANDTITDGSCARWDCRNPTRSLCEYGLAEVANGEIKIFSQGQAIAQAQEWVRSFVPEGRSLADELVAERRQEQLGGEQGLWSIVIFWLISWHSSENILKLL
jgi:hypothetical protein